MKSYFFSYARIEFKRNFKLVYKMFLYIICILAVSFAISFCMIQVMNNLVAYEKIDVGIVVPDGEEGDRLKVFTQLISTQQSVEDICNFVYMDEKEATYSIANGDIEAAIIFGSSFIEDVMTGVNTPARVLISSKSTLYSSVFFEEIANGVSLIKTGEAAIYSVTDAYIAGYDMVISRSEMEDMLTNLYMEKALERSSLMEDEVLSPFGDGSIEKYYIASFICIFMCFSGIIFSYLYAKEDRTIRKKLVVNGIGNIKAAIVRIFSQAIVIAFLCAIVILFLRLLSNIFGISMNIDMNISMLINILSLSVFLSTFFYFSYSLVNDSYKGAVFIILLSMIMIFLSGCILPISFLPDKLQVLSEFVPVYYLRNLCGFMISRGGIYSQINILLIYTICFAVFGILIQSFGKENR